MKIQQLVQLVFSADEAAHVGRILDEQEGKSEALVSLVEALSEGYNNFLTMLQLGAIDDFEVEIAVSQDLLAELTLLFGNRTAELDEAIGVLDADAAFLIAQNIAEAFIRGARFDGAITACEQAALHEAFESVDAAVQQGEVISSLIEALSLGGAPITLVMIDEETDLTSWPLDPRSTARLN